MEFVDDGQRLAAPSGMQAVAGQAAGGGAGAAGNPQDSAPVDAEEK